MFPNTDHDHIGSNHLRQDNHYRCSGGPLYYDHYHHYESVIDVRISRFVEFAEEVPSTCFGIVVYSHLHCMHLVFDMQVVQKKDDT